MDDETYTLGIAALYLVLSEIENTFHTACIKSAKPCVIDFSFDYGKIGLLRAVENISFYLKQEQSCRLTFLSLSVPCQTHKTQTAFRRNESPKEFRKTPFCFSVTAFRNGTFCCCFCFSLFPWWEKAKKTYLCRGFR